MLQKVKWLLGTVYGLLVVAALTFGTTQVLAAPAQVCGDDPEEIGTCPPLTNASCADACFDEFGTTGQCIGGCCVCVL